MKKPKKRKRKGLRKVTPKPLRQAHHDSESRSLWRTTLEILGGVAAVIAIALFVRDALREPEIHPLPGVAESPFELRFSLHNPSYLFQMSEMEFVCEASKINYQGNFRSERNTTAQDNLIASIEPGHTIVYRCPYTQLVDMGPGSIYFAQILITVKYKTLWKHRDSISEEFTWTAKSRHWIEGTIVN